MSPRAQSSRRRHRPQTPRRRAARTGLAVLWLALLVGPLSAADAAPKRANQRTASLTSEATREARQRAKQRRRQARHARPLGPSAADELRVPNTSSPSVHRRSPPLPASVAGWSAALDRPAYDDRRRRMPAADDLDAWTAMLRPGLNFRYELYFGGNPTGTIEAGVVARHRGASNTSDPSGGDMFELRAHAVTSGVLGMFAKVEDEMTSWVDVRTGASVKNENLVRRSGLMSPYKRRVTTTEFEGRGFVRVRDAKDERKRQAASRVPPRTLDPLSLIAWVRALDLAPGERAIAHTLDVTALLRVDIVSRGIEAPSRMPSLAAALGIGPGDIQLLEGTMTRVDRYGTPVEGKEPYTFRAWVSNDPRRIPILMETNIWVGTLRLILAGYDPPRDTARAARDAAPSR